jgi:phage I-like protein
LLIACSGDAPTVHAACSWEIEAAEGEVPEWVQIARTGVWHGRPQVGSVERQEITPEMLGAAQAWFERHDAGPGIPVDYHHASLFTPAVRAPAAGWVRAMELRAGGTELWGRVMWTTTAADEIADRQYRRLSPVLLWNAKDPKTGEPVAMRVHSVALTNTPLMPDLVALNQAALELEAGATDGAGDTATAAGGRAMDLLQSIAKALGIQPEEAAARLRLEAGAEDKDVAEALAAAATRVTELEAAAETPRPLSEAVANALGVATDADEEAVLAAVEGLKEAAPDGEGTPGELSVVANALGLPEDASAAKVLLAIQEALAGADLDEAERLVANAVQAGKIAPALREHYVALVRKDPEAGKELLQRMGALTAAQVDVAANEAGRDQGPKLTDAEAEVARLLGLTEEQMAGARG